MNYHNEPILEGFIRVIEVCPHCGAEIDIIVPEGAEKLNFCPNCGERDILLCSKCEDEIGDCCPPASCAYCHGHPCTRKPRFIVIDNTAGITVYKGYNEQTARTLQKDILDIKHVVLFVQE